MLPLDQGKAQLSPMAAQIQLGAFDQPRCSGASNDSPSLGTASLNSTRRIICGRQLAVIRPFQNRTGPVHRSPPMIVGGKPGFLDVRAVRERSGSRVPASSYKPSEGLSTVSNGIELWFFRRFGADGGRRSVWFVGRFPARLTRREGRAA
ncbi:hypothetical protein, partial [Methylobacterium sp. 1030]|uniref:hypothetical protein n=1 Tax=Methylobacterium sp. 1030 TaxID=3156404 RepID=UPI003393DB28